MTSNESIETPSGKDKEGENFPVGSFLVRPDLRKHIHACYIFARATDDISDNPLLEAEEKIRRLDLFAKALLDDADMTVPSVIPLRESLKETGITPQHALDLLIAFKRDAVKLRYENWDELLDYCRYSASPIGRQVLALHGIGEEAWPASDALCSILQIVNHIQDCADDYRELDRVYIPLDMLATNKSDPVDLDHESTTPGLRATLTDMLLKLQPMMKTASSIPAQIPDWRLKMEISTIYVLAGKLIKLLHHRDPLCETVKLGRSAMLEAVFEGILRAPFYKKPVTPKDAHVSSSL
jgi:squalene synthase HpnC